MRLDTDTSVWMVVDPTSRSELADCCVEVTLRKIELQFRRGLACEQHPTLFSDRKEAEIEAFGRLTAARTAEAIAEQARKGVLAAGPCKVVIHGADGQVLFEAEVGGPCQSR